MAPGPGKSPSSSDTSPDGAAPQLALPQGSCAEPCRSLSRLLVTWRHHKVAGRKERGGEKSNTGEAQSSQAGCGEQGGLLGSLPSPHLSDSCTSSWRGEGEHLYTAVHSSVHLSASVTGSLGTSCKSMGVFFLFAKLVPL